MSGQENSQKNKENQNSDNGHVTKRLADLAQEYIARGVCKCEGLGWVAFNFNVDHPDFGRYAQCVCMKKDSRAVLIRASNLQSYDEKRFRDYKTSWIENGEYVLETCYKWGAQENEQFLTLYGTTGVGKTHLALASAWTVVNQMNQAVLFAQASDLIRNLQSSMKAGNLNQEVNTYKSAKNLVIDDLGREYTTDWTTSIFHEIIDYRYRNHELRTFVTTNHSIDELNKIVGVPVVSRLTDAFKGNFVAIDGEDVRPRLLELKDGTK